MGLFRALAEKSWENPSTETGAAPRIAHGLPAEMIGLRFFLLVVALLFSLLTSVYFMRMAFPDWERLSDPAILWANTGLLVLASLAFESARRGLRRQRMDAVRRGLMLAGLLGIAFLAGQAFAWRQMAEMGYFATTNPSYAFFYLVTALHWVHLAGGVIAWRRTGGRVREGASSDRLRLSLDLCAVYWHFLLLVWIGMFALLLLT